MISPAKLQKQGENHDSNQLSRYDHLLHKVLVTLREIQMVTVRIGNNYIIFTHIYTHDTEYTRSNAA